MNTSLNKIYYSVYFSIRINYTSYLIFLSHHQIQLFTSLFVHWYSKYSSFFVRTIERWRWRYCSV